MSCKSCSLPCDRQRPAANWWPPSQIIFCDRQLQFMVANFGVIGMPPAKWPPKPSGYFDAKLDVQQSIKENVTWQQIIEARGELLLRIAKLPELMQNLIYDRRICWDAPWWDMVDQDVDAGARERLLTVAHDMINYLKGHWETRIINGEKRAVNVGNEMCFAEWKKQRERRRHR